MKFLARYICQYAAGEYFRTIYADNINEAMRLADRFARKGFITASFVQA